MEDKLSTQIAGRNQAGEQADHMRSLGEQVSLFKYFSAIDREMIFGFSKKRSFEDGQVILQQGQPASGLFMIQSGVVRVTRTNEEGEDIELARIGEGGHFGEMSLLNDQPLSASVQAAGEVETFVMLQDQFQNLLKLHKALSNKLLRAMCEELSNRLRKANLYIS